MRKSLMLLLLLTACSKSQTTDKTPPANQEATQQAPKAVSEATPKAEPEPKPPEPKPPVAKTVELPPIAAGSSWKLLIAEADSLKATWATLAAEERGAYYNAWALRTASLNTRLEENGSFDELIKMHDDDKVPASMTVVTAEGMVIGMNVSEAWLLKEFSGLPASEQEYLQWVDKMNRNDWFAEGELQVEVSEMTSAYKSGADLLSKYPNGFRNAPIRKTLAAIFDSFTTLLTQGAEPSDKQRYVKDVRAAFQVVLAGGVHKEEATAFIEKLPAKGLPYEYDQVENLSKSFSQTTP